MRPEELGARSLEAAAENDRKALTLIAAASDSGMRPGREVAERAGLPERTAREAVARLEARGLLRRDGRRRVWATIAGRSEAGADVPGLPLAPTLDSAISYLPAEALRAFARLQLAAVPARWHLCGEHAAGWPGFIALGPTKTGKTSIASLVCRVYGLDELRAIKAAFRETPGSLVGRRERDATSATGWRVERSVVLEQPYLCVDEADKAPRDVQAAAGGLLLGATADELEGERIEVRPTLYVTLNTGRDGLRVMHEAHVRRSVVLDTSPLRQLLVDIDESMARLFGGQVAIPRLELARIRPSAPTLPPDLRTLLRSELRSGLTEEGWQLTDVEPLARLALGRAAITGGDLEQAVLATALDYLTCTATLGQVKAGVAARLGPRLGTKGALLPDPTAAEIELDHRRSLEADRQRKTLETRYAFVADRERKAATAVDARKDLGRSAGPERAAIARALSAAAKDLRGARTAVALDAAWQAATPHIEQARAWKQARDAEANERARAAADARHRQELERPRRAEDKQHASGARAAARRRAEITPQEDPVVDEIAQLERLLARTTTRAVENVLGELQELRILGGQPIVTFESDQPGETVVERLVLLAARFVGAASGSISTGTWRCPFDPTLALRGTETTCQQLASWQSDDTQRVLRSALGALRGQQHLPAAVLGVPQPITMLAAPQATAPGGLFRGRCTHCQRIHAMRGPRGLQRDFCPNCNEPLEPLG